MIAQPGKKGSLNLGRFQSSLPPDALEYKMKADKKLQPVINKETVLTSANKLVQERPAHNFALVQ